MRQLFIELPTVSTVKIIDSETGKVTESEDTFKKTFELLLDEGSFYFAKAGKRGKLYSSLTSEQVEKYQELLTVS